MVVLQVLYVLVVRFKWLFFQMCMLIINVRLLFYRFSIIWSLSAVPYWAMSVRESSACLVS